MLTDKWIREQTKAPVVLSGHRRLADAAYKKALKEVGDEMMKMSTLQEFHALRVRLIQGKLDV